MYMLVVSTQPCHGGYLLEMAFLKVMPHIICSLLCGQTHLLPFRRFISAKKRIHQQKNYIYIYTIAEAAFISTPKKHPKPLYIQRLDPNF